MNARESHEELLPLYVSGDLTPGERDRVEAWLAESEDARSRLAALRRTYDLLARAGAGSQEVPDLSNLCDERIAPALRARRTWVRPMLSAALVLLAFGAGIAVERSLSPGATDASGVAPPTRQAAQPPPATARVARAYRESQGARSSFASSLIGLALLGEEPR